MNITHNNYPAVKSYIKMWKEVIRLAKEKPDAKIDMGWNLGGIVTAEQARQKFLDAMVNRINSRGKIYDTGKKYDYDYFCSEMRDKYRLQDHYNKRIIIHQFETKECQKRFSYLVWNEDY